MKIFHHSWPQWLQNIDLLFKFPTTVDHSGFKILNCYRNFPPQLTTVASKYLIFIEIFHHSWPQWVQKKFFLYKLSTTVDYSGLKILIFYKNFPLQFTTVGSKYLISIKIFHHSWPQWLLSLIHISEPTRPY